MIWGRIFGGRIPPTHTAPGGGHWPVMEPGKLSPIVSEPAPVTCAEAGRGGYIVRHDRERAKIRETTIALAEKIGRPDLAEPLR